MAVLENRTVLWDTDGSCGTSLVPQEWLPSFREWYLNHNTTIARHEFPKWNGTEDELDRSNSSILVWNTPLRNHVVGPRQSVVSREEVPGGILPESDLYRRALTLGHDFLFGMLFSYAFSFRSKTLPPPILLPDATDEDYASRVVQTIAVDARSWSNMDPSSIMKCLESSIDPELTCQVLVLSNHTPESSDVDKKLESWLLSRNCTVTTTKRAYAVNATQPSRQDWYFWSDVALTSNARYGYVGPGQDALVLQLIEYYRRTEMWKLGRDPPLLPINLTRCVWYV